MTCKCQELHAPGKQPGRSIHASNKYVRKRRKSAVSYWDWKKILRASLTSCFWLYIVLARQILISSLVSRTQAADARRHAGSRQLCLLACVVTLWSARTCFAALCMADCAAVLCCGRCSTTTCYIRSKLGVLFFVWEAEAGSKINVYDSRTAYTRRYKKRPTKQIGKKKRGNHERGDWTKIEIESKKSGK